MTASIYCSANFIQVSLVCHRLGVLYINNVCQTLDEDSMLVTNIFYVAKRLVLPQFVHWNKKCVKEVEFLLV